MFKKLAIIAALSLLAPLTYGQTAPSSAPASAPAAARKTLVVPPGFKVITANDHSMVVEPGDEAWVRKALSDMKPTTMPTTMPADLVTRIKSRKSGIIQRMVGDLALADRAEVERFFADSAEKAVAQIEQIQPALFYIVTTEKRLAELMRNGWQNDRFYYNRIADTVQQNPNIDIYSKDDLLIPAVYTADDDAEKKTSTLTATIHAFEEQATNELSYRGMSELRRELRAYLVTHVLPTEKVQADQAWFVIGVSNVLALRYLADLTGMPDTFWFNVAEADFQRNPMRALDINLLRPTSDNELRPESIMAYREAFGFRSLQLAYNWMNRAGDAGLTKTIMELRKNFPADAPAMIKQIQAASGVDLTAQPAPASAPAAAPAK